MAEDMFGHLTKTISSAMNNARLIDLLEAYYHVPDSESSNTRLEDIASIIFPAVYNEAFEDEQVLDELLSMLATDLEFCRPMVNYGNFTRMRMQHWLQGSPLKDITHKAMKRRGVLEDYAKAVYLEKTALQWDTPLLRLLLDGKSVLDYGCGIGFYLLFCWREMIRPAMYSGYDQSEIIEIAQKFVEKFADRAKKREDFDPCPFKLIDSIPGGDLFDVVLISDVLHGRSESEAYEILLEAGSHLQPASKLLIIEQMPNTNVGRLFHLHMKAMSKNGRAMPADEVVDIIGRSGVKLVVSTVVSISSQHYMVECMPLAGTN